MIIDVLFKKSYLLTDFCSHWVFAVAVGLSPAVASGGHSQLWSVGFSSGGSPAAEHELYAHGLQQP